MEPARTLSPLSALVLVTLASTTLGFAFHSPAQAQTSSDTHSSTPWWSPSGTQGWLGSALPAAWSSWSRLSAANVGSAPTSMAPSLDTFGGEGLFQLADPIVIEAVEELLEPEAAAVEQELVLTERSEPGRRGFALSLATAASKTPVVASSFAQPRSGLGRRSDGSGGSQVDLAFEWSLADSWTARASASGVVSSEDEATRGRADGASPDEPEIGSALGLQLSGRLQGFQVAAGYSQVSDGFRDQRQQRARPAGSRAHVTVQRREKHWRMKALVQSSTRNGREKVETRITTGFGLPLELQSEVGYRQVVLPGRTETRTHVGLHRDFGPVRVNLRTSELEKLAAARGEPILQQETGVELRYRPAPGLVLTGGSSQQNRTLPHGEIDLERLYLHPVWKVDDGLKIKVRLERTIENRLGTAAPVERRSARGSLVWKVRNEDARADLKLDVAYRAAAGRASEPKEDRSASLGVVLRLR